MTKFKSFQDHFIRLPAKQLAEFELALQSAPGVVQWLCGHEPLEGDRAWVRVRVAVEYNEALIAIMRRLSVSPC